MRSSFISNLLVYARSAGYVSASLGNVVVNGVAQNVTLTDDDVSNFYCPKEFTARAVSYTHNYGLPTIPGVSAGWESIALPFDVESYAHTAKGEIAPFKQRDAGEKPFWLYEYSESGFVAADGIKADTPYIISMPNNEEYIDDYILAGNVTFSAQEARIKKSEELNRIESNGRVFTPNYIHSDGEGKYCINVAEEYNGHARGSLFAPDYRAVRPFEGYFTDYSGVKKAIMIFDDDVSRVEDITTYENQDYMNIYTIGGALVRRVRPTEDINITDGLSKGIYLINKRKIYIK